MLFRSGIAFFKIEAIPKALKDFIKIAKEWPRYNKSTYIYLFMIYMKINNVSKAIDSVYFIIILVKRGDSYI